MQTDTNDNDRVFTVKGKGMALNQKVTIQEIGLNKIKLGRNSRLSVSNDDLSGLMQSINSTGLLEPIGVVKTKDGKGYEIAYGNRRFMAFTKLGLHSIPCIVHERKSDDDVDVKNLVENVQRRNISLAEVGRYAALLEGEGLSVKELAIRMGCSIEYVRTCVKAWEQVPKDFRGDLQVAVSGKPLEPGKISINAAKAIMNTQKAYGLTKPQINTLYKAAKSDERFNTDNVPKYAEAMKRGAKDPIGHVRPIKTLTFRFIMNESEYDSLMNKYVEKGPFNSFTALVKAVLRGQKQVSINFIE